MINKINIAKLLLVLCWSLLYAKVGVINIDDSLTHINIAPYTSYFTDYHGVYNLSDIQSINEQGQFEASPGILNFGYSNSVYWFSFDVNYKHYGEDKVYLHIANPFLDSIEIFIPDGQNKFKHIVYGDSYPFNVREIKYQTFVVPLSTKNESGRYFLRVKSKEHMSLPISIWREKTIINHMHSSNTVLGMYYGLMLVMMLFNFVLFFLMKDKSMLYFSLFVCFYVLFQIHYDGTGFQYLWPNSPFIQAYGLPVLLFISGSSILIFIREYLRTKDHIRRVDHYILVYLGVSTLLVLISIFISRSMFVQVSTVGAVVATILSLLISIVSLFQKSREAVFYFFGFIIFVLGTIFTSISVFGLVKIPFLSEWSMQIGSVLMVLVMSTGMMDKINTLKIQYNKNILRIKSIYSRLDDRFNQLDTKVGNIKKLANLLSEITNDLSIKVKTTNDGILHTAIAVDTVSEQTVRQNDMVTDLHNNIFEIMELLTSVIESGKKQVDMLTGASEKVLFNHKEILYQSGQAENQSKDLDKTKQVVKKMIEDVESITNKSLDVAACALKAVQVAEKGETVVNDSVDGMNIIKEKIFNIAEKVEYLSTSTQEIEVIIESIDHLSKQTNVLSLNAAIEASRAGAHGLGFAVVADEVRHLAERSVVNTKAIITIIDNIRLDEEELTQSMDKGIVEVMNGYDSIQKMQAAFTNIIQDIRSTVDEIQNISTSSEDLNRLSSTVKEMLNTIYSSIDDNLSTMEQLSNNSEQIVSDITEIKQVSNHNQIVATGMTTQYQSISKKTSSILRISKENKTEAERTSSITGDMAKAVGLIKNFILELDFMTVQLLKRG